MRNLEDIEKDLAAAREALSSVEGTPAEVYSRIVGYYRSVRNWNLGKREEYGERRLYRIRNSDSYAAASSLSFGAATGCQSGSSREHRPDSGEFRPAPVLPDMRGNNCRGEAHLLLFVRSSCPGCPPAKAAAEQLGIPVDLVNTDLAEGFAEAVRYNVMSTPTAILVSPEGEELKRVRDAAGISRMFNTAVPEPAAAMAV